MMIAGAILEVFMNPRLQIPVQHRFGMALAQAETSSIEPRFHDKHLLRPALIKS
jgi:hypothetical protein